MHEPDSTDNLKKTATEEKGAAAEGPQTRACFFTARRF